MKKRSQGMLCLALALVLCAALLAGCSGGGAPAGGQQSSAPPAQQDAPGGGAATPAEEPVTLIMGHAFSSTNNKAVIWQEVADEIYESSGGTVILEQAYDATLCDDSNMMDSVVNNITQVGPGVYTYMTGVIPELSALCIPGYFAGDEEEWLQFCEELQEPLEALFAKHNLKFLASDYTAFSCLFGNGKQVLTPADCSGLLIRTSGNNQSDAVKIWGGASTVIGIGDLATALDRGTVDYAFSAYALVKEFGFYEMIDYCTYTSMYDPAHCFFMSMDVWNSLSENQQQAILKGFDGIEKKTYERLVELEYEPYKEIVAGSGVTIAELNDEETGAFTEPLKPLFDNLIAGNSKEGLAILKIVYKYNGWEWTAD